MAEGGKKVSVLVELKIQVGPSIYVICLQVFKSRGRDCLCIVCTLRSIIKAVGDAQEM